MRGLTLRSLAVFGTALAVAGCDPASASLHAGTRTGSASSRVTFGQNVVDFYVVAHEDDDLLFINPDISYGIQGGDGVVVVYLTAGDAGRDAAYWGGREAGIHAAYAAMASVLDAWNTNWLTVGSKSVKVDTLAANPNVRVVFLRLPDGNMNGSGFAATGSVSLQQLWNGVAATLPTVDGADSYSADDLTAVLAGLMTQFGATTLGTLDSSGIYGTYFSSRTDHSDHYHSSLFANAAAAQVSIPGGSWMYRGYNISIEAENLDSSSQVAKTNTFISYSSHDGSICANPATCAPSGQYVDWVKRQYYVEADPFPAGGLVSIGYKCLTVTGANSGNGTPLQMFACTGGPEQQWMFAADGSLRGLGGKCVDVRAANQSNGTVLQLYDCVDVPQQKWSLSADGHVIGLAGKCLDDRGGRTDDGTQAQLWDCVSVLQQYWTLH